jgi:rubrerythrin
MNRCACGARLVGYVEQWTGECETCSPPPSLDVRFRSSAHIATASVNGRERLDREAARVASFGYSVEDELREVGPEPSGIADMGEEIGTCLLCGWPLFDNDRTCPNCNERVRVDES